MLVCTGCRPTDSVPTREALIQLLGELDPSVRILGGANKSDDGKSDDVSLLADKQDANLWVVTSLGPLPLPTSKDAKSSKRESLRNVKVVEKAFPGQIIYQIAEATGVRAKELPPPAPGSLQTLPGRLTEWSTAECNVRVRDIQTESGWLSIIETMPN